MLYLLLAIIIVLLGVIIFSKRDKGTHFRNLFSDKHFSHLKKFEENDPRNKSHPDELVIFGNHFYMKRSEAEEKVNLYRKAGTDDEAMKKIIG